MRSTQREELNRLKARLSDLHKELSHDLLKLVSQEPQGRITVDAVRLQDKVSKIETALFLLREI